jgi:hypothetical protein
VIVLAGAVAGCGHGSGRESITGEPAGVSVGRPTAVQRVDTFGTGAIELRAASPGESGRPSWFAMVLLPRGGNPRDVCIATGLIEEDAAEANPSCGVAVRGAATSFIEAPGVPVRYNGSPTVISGRAPIGVRSVRLEGPGGTRRLPLSAHRAFLAVYASGVRGRVRVISAGPNGESVRSFALPLSPRFDRHPHRRRGAVFNDDDIGKDITSRSYGQLVRRYGPPAVVRRERGLRCAYYELVGFPQDGWRFCFAPNGRIVRASANSPPP